MSHGRILAIVGCMFAGKTEELFRLLVRERYAGRKVLVFKHVKDTRCPTYRIETHDGRTHPARAVSSAAEIRSAAFLDTAVAVVAIDEVQFFEPDIIEVMEELARAGITAIATGLTTDFRARPYKHVPHLMAVADEVYMCTAICMRCGSEANRSQLLAAPPPDGEDKPGGAGMYEARCRTCHKPPTP